MSYSQRLGAVEIDSTFNHIPTARMVDAWIIATPEDFRFAPKALLTRLSETLPTS